MRKTLLLLALASVSAFLVVACSSNSSTPIDPEPGQDLVPPAAPASLSVELQGNTVHLNWRENIESDLAGYRVYRLGDGISASNLDEVYSAGYYERLQVTNPMIVEYSVTAFDLSGNESAYSTTVEVLIGCVDDVSSKDDLGTGL